MRVARFIVLQQMIDHYRGPDVHEALGKKALRKRFSLPCCDDLRLLKGTLWIDFVLYIFMSIRAHRPQTAFGWRSCFQGFHFEAKMDACAHFFLLPLWPRLGSYIIATIAVALYAKERERGCEREMSASIFNGKTKHECSR